MLAVNSAERPHLHGHNLPAQVGEMERPVGVEPHIVDEFWREAEVGEG